MSASHFVAYVNSRNRYSGTTSDFSFVIDMPDGGSGATFDSVCVLQAAIPKSYYLIDTGRNTFTLGETSIGGVTTIVTITIEPGNYTRRSFAYALAGLLNQSSPNHLTYSVLVPDTTHGPDTGKYRFTVNSLVVPQPYFAFSETSSPADQMGFLQNTTYQFVPSGGQGLLDSAQVCNLQLDESVYLMSDAIVNGSANILQEILATSPDFGIMQFDVGASGGIIANRKQLIHSRRNTFHFQILNTDFEPLNLNGINLSFSLLFWDSTRYKPQ